MFCLPPAFLFHESAEVTTELLLAFVVAEMEVTDVE